MAVQPSSHPYLHWILTRQSFPRVWQCILAAVMLWIASATAIVHLLSQAPTIQGPTARILWLIGIGTTIASLLTAMTFSVLLTHREVLSERRQLLRLANYSSQTLIRDYTFNTLYRIRPLMVLAFGLSPTLAPGWAHYLITQETARLCILSVRACQLTDFSLLPMQGAALAVISVLVSLTFLSSIVACSALAVWMTLRWQDIGLALTISLGLFAASLVPLLLCFALYINAALHIVIRYDSPLSIVLTLPVVAVMGAIPHLLITETAWSRSPRWAWHKLASRGGTSDGDDTDRAHRLWTDLIRKAWPSISGWLRRSLDLSHLPRANSARGSSRH